MAVPFLNSITLNKNEVQDFKVYNIGTGNPTLSSGGDIGYFWTDTTGSASARVLKWWDGSNVRTVLDSSSTTVIAADLSGGAAGSLPYQQGASDTTFLGIGTAGQVLKVNSGATAPEWTAQSNLSVGTATFLAGGTAGDIPVQSAAGTTGFLNIGANGRILTSNGSTPVWSATIPSSSVSGLAASATTDTTNAANITSGLLPLARLALATGQFYLGDASNNPVATAKTSIPLSGFGAAGADVAMGGFKITGLADPVDATDAANRKYVDEVAQGLDVKASCLVGTIANINLSAPGSSIDGISLSSSNRVLVKDQTDKKQNGIYVWNGAAVAMTRSLDADTVAKLVGAFTFVEQGTNADSGWVCQVDSGTIGSVDIEWVKFSQAGSYTAGNGMVLSGGVFHFAQDTNYTAGRIPFASGNTTIGFSSNLFWDNSNSRLGIGTATVDGKVHIYGDTYANSQLRIQRNGAVNGTFSIGIAGTNNTLYIQDEVNATARLIIDGSGNLGLGAVPVAADGAAKTFQVGGRTVIQSTVGTQTLFANNAYYDGAWKRIVEGYSNAIRFNGLGSSGANAGAITFSIAASGSAGSTITNWDSSDIRMVLSASGNLGIGTTTPNHKLQISNDGSVAHAVRIYDTGANASYLALNASNTDTGIIASGSSAVPINFYTGGTLRATLDSSGNLGLGVTPYVHASTYKTLQLGNGGNYATLAGSSNSDGGADAYGQLVLGNNSYDFPNNKAVATGASAIYLQSGGRHRWYTAPSTNAGTLQSFTNTMTLDASGNLLVGTTTATSKFVVSSSGDTLATIIGGAANAKGISFYDASTNGCQIYSVSSDIRFFTTASGSSTERARIDSSGNLGLGATPSAWVGGRALDVGTSGSLFGDGLSYDWRVGISTGIYRSGSPTSWFYKTTGQSAGAYQIWASNATGVTHAWYSVGSGTVNNAAALNTQMVLDASGRLLIGTASARSNFFNSSVTTQLQVEGDGAASFVRNVNDVYGGVLVLGKIRGASIVQNNDRVSQISFQGSDGTEFVECANISAEIDGAPGANDMPGRLVFSTTSDGAAAPTERLRIKSTGQVNFTGLAADPTGAAGDVYYNSGSNVFKVYDTGWKTLPRKYVVQLSDGSVTVVGNAYTLTHNFGTQDVTVSIRRTTDNAVVQADVVMPAGGNTVTVTFAAAITAAQFYVTVIG